MNVPTRQQNDLIEKFENFDLPCPVALSDMQSGDQFDPTLIAPNTYLAQARCDNCSATVYLNIAVGLEQPDECPSLPCPTCRCTGHIFRPPTEGEIAKAIRRRLDTDEQA